MKTNANIGFEKQLWDAACVLWGHIPAAEYRKVIIGLIFLRYISAAFDKRYKELIAEGDGFEDDRDAYTMENVFFVPEESRWPAIAAAAHTPEIGMVIDNAMRAIETENKTLKNVLPKNYASPDLDKKVLGDVVDIFTNNIHTNIASRNLRKQKVKEAASSIHLPASSRHLYQSFALLQFAVCMIAVAALAACLYRAQNSFKHIQESGELLLSMVRRLMLTHGKWLK